MVIISFPETLVIFHEGVEDFYLKSPKPLGSIGHALTRELSSDSDL